MNKSTIEKKIKKILVSKNAPLVEINEIKGIKEMGEDIIVDELYVSMGECTGEEFEAIKSMREQIEIDNKILITNVIIYL